MSIKDRPRSRHFADLLDEISERTPDKEFVVSGAERLTYADMLGRAERAAKGLYALGLRPGDRLAVLMTNRIEWLEMAFGAFAIGATVVPLSSWYRPWDIEYTLRHARARILVTLDRFRSNTYVDYIRQLAPELDSSSGEGRLNLERFPTLENIVVLGDASLPGLNSYDELLALADSVADEDIQRCRQQASFTDLAFILYTSGTSATPKGVMMQQGQCLENAFAIGERQHQNSDDRLWLAVSFAWSFGAANALPAIMTHGGTLVLQEFFEPGEALRLFQEERITVVYTINNMVNALVSHPDIDKYDRSTLRTGVTTGLPEEVRRAIEDLGATQICQATGGTETYGNCCVSDADESPNIRMTSNGRPLPGVTVVIVDPETRQPLPDNQIGEFTVIGKYLVPGYWDDPERTAVAFPNGQYIPGDLAFIDDDGRVHFEGRLTEMIKTGGINVAPAEVENFLTTHPDILEAYVIGAPSPQDNQIPIAYIQRRPDSSVSGAEIDAFCRQWIASYKIPRDFIFLMEDEVPRTSTGKVVKRDLLSRYEQVSAGASHED
jgi:fatty-acyl-CoA synthase